MVYLPQKDVCFCYFLAHSAPSAIKCAPVFGEIVCYIICAKTQLSPGKSMRGAVISRARMCPFEGHAHMGRSSFKCSVQRIPACTFLLKFLWKIYETIAFLASFGQNLMLSKKRTTRFDRFKPVIRKTQENITIFPHFHLISPTFPKFPKFSQFYEVPSFPNVCNLHMKTDKMFKII